MPRSYQAWAGELIGTFGFVTIGAGSVIVATGQLADIGTLGVALAHGLGLAVMVSVFAAISGGHFNPAVTLSALIGRKIRAVDALGYVACQILGALGAALTLRVMFPEAAWRPSNLGAPGLTVSSGKGVLVEAVLTFFLVLVVWGTAIDERGPRVGGFAIGLTVMAVILGAGPLTGAALNPARYLGPAAVADQLSDWWVYFVGPGIGGIAAGLLYPTLFWGGFPWARIGGSRHLAPASESTLDVAGARKPRAARKARPAARKPASRKR